MTRFTKGQLLALGFVHDLRGPVAAAARAFQVLEGLLGHADGEARLFRDAVRTSLRRAECVADDWEQVLLPLDHGRGDRRSDRVALTPLLRGLVDEMGSEMNALPWTVRVAPLPAVYGHASALRAVFRNLLDNARRYRRPRAPLRVDIGATTAGSIVHIWIRDNGRGIPAGHRRSVLEPFCRAPGSPGAGSGIGLALARRIVADHGGDLRLTSRRGHGSTVWVTLPRTR